MKFLFSDSNEINSYKTNLPHGSVEGHLAFPDLVEHGLAGRVPHEVHVLGRVSDLKQCILLEGVYLSHQQPVCHQLVSFVTFIQNTNSKFLNLPMGNKIHILITMHL